MLNAFENKTLKRGNSMNKNSGGSPFRRHRGEKILLALCLVLAAGLGMAGESPSERLDIIRRVISERGEYDLAERQLQLFINELRERPIAAEALVLLGYCQDKQKKNQEAAASYLKAVKDYPDAPAPLKADAHLGAADAFYRLGRFEDAVGNYTEVLALTEKPDQAEAALLWRAEANYRMGMAEKDAGRDGKRWLDESAADFISYIDKYPDSKNLPSALYGAAFACFDDGDYEKSLAFLGRFVDSFPADRRAEECQYYLGEALYRLKRYNEAKQAFGKVLSDYPDGKFSPDARSGIAWADHALGKTAEAAAGFEEAAKLAGDDRELALSYLYDAGCAWREAGDTQKAATPLLEVAKASDHELNGLAWFRLGTLWQEQAKTARDRVDAATTREERDKFVALRSKMGEDAIMYFRRALDSGKLGPEEVEARSILGEVLLDAGRYAEAAAEFAQVAERWPDSPRAPWALYHEALAYRELSQSGGAADSGETLRKAVAALRHCLEYPDSKVRLQAAWALADYQAELGETEASRTQRRWLASEGVDWARAWKDAEGKGDPSLERRARQYAADSLFQLGEDFYFASDLPRAAGYYQEILASYAGTPQAAMALLRLGEIAENGKDVENAAKRYQESLRVGEKLPHSQVAAAMGYSRLRLGVLRLREGQRTRQDAAGRAKIQEALSLLQAVAGDPPGGMNVSRLYYYLAEAKYGLDLKKEAIGDYEKSLAEEEKGELADAAWFGLAWAKRDLKDFPGALEASRRLIDGFPDSQLRPDALILSAAIHREAGEPEMALSDLEQFIADYPSHALSPKAELERASALDEVGRHDEAAAAFQKFLADYPDSPDSAQALYQRSWALWNQIKPKVSEAREAEKEWNALTGGLDIEELPEEERPAAMAAKDAMEQTAAAVRSAEDDILASLRELTERYPDYPVVDAAWLRIGEILYDRSDFPQAANAYAKALSVAESRKSDLADKAQYRLAWSIQRQAENAERIWRTAKDSDARESARSEMWDKRLAAVNAFESLIGKFPRSDLLGEACFRAAELRRRSGQDNVDVEKRSGWYSTAVQRYKQALGKGGKDAAYRRAAECGLALSLLLDGKNTEARERFQKFLFNFADGPYTQEAYWGLGSANLELGAYAEAGSAFEQALSLDKATETAAKSRYGLGLTAVMAGDHEQARMEFHHVDLLYPQYPEWAALALLQAAKTAKADGMLDKAISDLERLLARYPEAPAAEEARAMQAELSSGDV